MTCLALNYCNCVICIVTSPFFVYACIYMHANVHAYLLQLGQWAKLRLTLGFSAGVKLLIDFYTSPAWYYVNAWMHPWNSKKTMHNYRSEIYKKRKKWEVIKIICCCTFYFSLFVELAACKVLKKAQLQLHA